MYILEVVIIRYSVLPMKSHEGPFFFSCRLSNQWFCLILKIHFITLYRKKTVCFKNMLYLHLLKSVVRLSYIVFIYKLACRWIWYCCFTIHLHQIKEIYFHFIHQVCVKIFIAALFSFVLLIKLFLIYTILKSVDYDFHSWYLVK